MFWYGDGILLDKIRGEYWLHKVVGSTPSKLKDLMESIEDSSINNDVTRTDLARVVEISEFMQRKLTDL